ncbi:jg21670 [Pararge aegeria aegeria]|uniref:Jg21670 protein n=1 Tax=Pararge aegeria aegeria TaxID=348720 RepID=A0A8S4QP71_9NEOP|nr:jg21670 [Pararge aegeria aegeria]
MYIPKNWWEALAVASYHRADKDVPLIDLVFRCDVTLKPIRGMTTILPNRLARYHLRLHHQLPPGFELGPPKVKLGSNALRYHRLLCATYDLSIFKERVNRQFLGKCAPT